MNPNTPAPLNMGNPKPLNMGTPTPLNFNLSGSQVSTGSQSNQGAFSASGIPWAPPAIPIETATGSTTPLPLPNTPTSQSAPALTAAAGGYIQPPAQVEPTGAPAQPTTGQTPSTGIQETGNYKQDFLNQVDAIGKLPGELADKYQVAKKLEDYNASKAKYDLLNEQYRVQEERVRSEAGLTVGQSQARIAELERKRAFSAGTLAIEYAAKNADYVGAKELMNQQLQLELEPIRMKADFYRDMYMKTEDQRFQRQMKAEERAYDQAQAAGEMANNLQLGAMQAGMTPQQAAKFVSNPTAKQASARAGVIQAVKDYEAKVLQFRPKGSFLTPLTPREKAELEAALNTTVGSAINVAQGQGAMGNEEAQRILGGLRVGGGVLKGNKMISSVANGIVGAQQSLLNSDLDFLSIQYPGVRNLPMFSPMMSDEEFFGGTANNAAMVPAVDYFNIEL